MPTERIPAQFACPRLEGRAVVSTFDGGRITNNVGASLPGAADRVIGLTRRVCHLLPTPATRRLWSAMCTRW